MFDLEDFLLLLEKKYINVLLTLLLVAFCLWVVTRKWRYELKIIAIMVSLFCAFLIVRGIYVEYYLIALGEEVDLKAERAFSIIKKKLNDRELVRLLSEGRTDQNQQFYIALMAAERGLQVQNAKDISRPGFFGTNS